MPDAYWQAQSAQKDANSGKSNAIPWPTLNGQNWKCICRAFHDCKNEKNCPNGPEYCFGYAAGKDLTSTHEAARAMSRERLKTYQTIILNASEL